MPKGEVKPNEADAYICERNLEKARKPSQPTKASAGRSASDYTHLKVKMEFMGHYNEPKLVISHPVGTTATYTLVYNPFNGTWETSSDADPVTATPSSVAAAPAGPASGEDDAVTATSGAGGGAGASAGAVDGALAASFAAKVAIA